MTQTYKTIYGVVILFCFLISCGGQAANTGVAENNSNREIAPLSAENTRVSETQSAMQLETIPLNIGQTKIQALVFKGKNSGLLLFNMHDDEKTSQEVSREFVKENGGTFVELAHGGERLITFELNGKVYKFDPNRIFTKIGISKTLSKYGNSSPEAESEVGRFANELITRFLSSPDTIVAMHNNTNGDYSVLSYQKGGEFENDAIRVSTDPKNDTDDFFYVTEEKRFDLLMSNGYNVVLQNNDGVTDDGSLSVFCGQKKIRYVNVEAEHGHRDQQVKMLNFLFEALKN